MLLDLIDGVTDSNGSSWRTEMIAVSVASLGE